MKNIKDFLPSLLEDSRGRNIRLVIVCCSAANFHWLHNLGTLGSLQLLRYQVQAGSRLFYVFATNPTQEHTDSFSMCVCTWIFPVAGSHST